MFTREQEFIKKCKGIYSDEDCQQIEYALSFASECHKGQVRESGEPYITHPIATAETLIDLGMDPACICAALLHDVVEDTACDGTTLKKKFGEEIYTLVEAVTKLSKLKSKFSSRVEEQAENLRKLFFAISLDLRVLFIKLADRLHNMRTLDALKPEKQLRIARETLADGGKARYIRDKVRARRSVDEISLSGRVQVSVRTTRRKARRTYASSDADSHRDRERA